MQNSDENSGFRTVVWSPDGQRLGYLRVHQAADKLEHLIETSDLKGGQPVLVLSDPKVWDPCWLPDGRMIYSMSEPAPNADDSNLWEVRIHPRSGKPISKPRRVTNWSGSSLWDLSGTADGSRVAFSRQSWHLNVYVGDLEANGTRLKSSRRLTLTEGTSAPSAWTADGKAVLFHSDRNGRFGVFKQTLGRVSAETLVTGPEDYLVPRLSADGAWVLYAVFATLEEAGPTTAVNVMRVPLSGGVPQFVLKTPAAGDYRCARSPATLCVLGEPSTDQKQLVFIDFDPLKGRGREVTRVDTEATAFYNWDLSSDGKLLALAKAGESEGHIRILPLGGGAARDIKVKGWGALNSLDWTADGNGFFAGSTQWAKGATLLHIDLQGNAQAIWMSVTTGQTWGVPSPDGKKIAILGPTSERNVWIIENF